MTVLWKKWMGCSEVNSIQFRNGKWNGWLAQDPSHWCKTPPWHQQSAGTWMTITYECKMYTSYCQEMVQAMFLAVRTKYEEEKSWATGFIPQPHNTPIATHKKTAWEHWCDQISDQEKIYQLWMLCNSIKQLFALSSAQCSTHKALLTFCW